MRPSLIQSAAMFATLVAFDLNADTMDFETRSYIRGALAPYGSPERAQAGKILDERLNAVYRNEIGRLPDQSEEAKRERTETQRALGYTVETMKGDAPRCPKSQRIRVFRGARGDVVLRKSDRIASFFTRLTARLNEAADRRIPQMIPNDPKRNTIISNEFEAYDEVSLSKIEWEELLGINQKDPGKFDGEASQFIDLRLPKLGRSHSFDSSSSLFISTSLDPRIAVNYGPPLLILEICPERAIFSAWSIFPSEQEILIPFTIFPEEIVAYLGALDPFSLDPLFEPLIKTDFFSEPIPPTSPLGDSLTPMNPNDTFARIFFNAGGIEYSSEPLNRLREMPKDFQTLLDSSWNTSKYREAFESLSRGTIKSSCASSQSLISELGSPYVESVLNTMQKWAEVRQCQLASPNGICENDAKFCMPLALSLSETKQLAQTKLDQFNRICLATEPKGPISDWLVEFPAQTFSGVGCLVPDFIPTSSTRELNFNGTKLILAGIESQPILDDVTNYKSYLTKPATVGSISLLPGKFSWAYAAHGEKILMAAIVGTGSTMELVSPLKSAQTAKFVANAPCEYKIVGLDVDFFCDATVSFNTMEMTFQIDVPFGGRTHAYQKTKPGMDSAWLDLHGSDRPAMLITPHQRIPCQRISVDTNGSIYEILLEEATDLLMEDGHYQTGEPFDTIFINDKGFPEFAF